MTAYEETTHIPLGPGWQTWKRFVVRSAGFPTTMVQALQDPQLAEASDQFITGAIQRQRYYELFSEAEDRMTAALRASASNTRFREAVSWQNPDLITRCLDKTAAGERRNVRGRNHQATIAAYLQRYSLKNDTIGFFGPVAWGEWTDIEGSLTTTRTSSNRARRTLYHEYWAIDTLATSLTSSALCRPYAVPRKAPATSRAGRLVHHPRDQETVLSSSQLAVAEQVDGERTISEIADALASSGYPQLASVDRCWQIADDLVSLGVLNWDWVGPIEARPELRLRQRLLRIDDSQLRRTLVSKLDHYLDVAETVTAAQGSDEELVVALDRLGTTFIGLTGRSPSRRPGQTYAGRTLVYEDVRSDLQMQAGSALRKQLGPALALILQTGNWLTNRIAQEYRNLFEDLYDRKRSKTGLDAVSLSSLLSTATPHIFFSHRRLPPPVLRAQAEFQKLWGSVHQTFDGGPDVHLELDQARERISAAFSNHPPTPPWSMAYTHTPDLMLAHNDQCNTGFLGVLGEVHLAVNTLESRVFVEQSDSADWMLRAAEASVATPRYYAVPSKFWPGVTSRLSPPSALLSPLYRYWLRHDPCVEVPAECVPGCDLTVQRDENGELTVFRRGGERFGPLLEVVGEYLSGVAVNAFSLMPSWHRRPQIRIGDLVVSRKSWKMSASDLDWAMEADERLRFSSARQWRRSAGVPEQVFYKTPVDDKPMFMDGSSVVLVNELAKAIRQSTKDQGSVTMTEMLPNFDQLWLRDGQDQLYTFELRMVTNAVPWVGQSES